MANQTIDGTLEWLEILSLNGKVEQSRVWSPVAIFFLLSLCFVARKLFRNRTLDQFYKSQPYAGRNPQQWFSSLRATLRSFFHNAEQVRKGYAQYAKRNIPFLVPNFRTGPSFVCPPGLLQTILGKPESKLAAVVPMSDFISSEYTIRDPHVYPSELHSGHLRNEVTKRLALLAPDLSAEVPHALDQIWGTTKEWNTVINMGSIENIVARTITRVSVPLPLCRDENYLNPLQSYCMSVLRNGILIQMFPSFMRPVIGPLIAWKGKRECESCIKILIPIVNERLAQYKRYLDISSNGWKPPNDILQVQIEQGHATGDPEQLSPRRIANRLIIVSFSAIDGVSIALSHVLLDLFSTPPSEGYVETLRQECDTVIKENPEGCWTKDKISRLVLLDSTIRESMRHSDHGWTALARRVTAPNGLTVSPSLTIPRGVNVQVPIHSIHMDPDFHHDPEQFLPFRFAPPESIPKSNPSSLFSSGTEPYANANPDHPTDTAHQPPDDYAKSLVTLDATFLSFGYRQHSCPGRYIAVHLMKVILANMLQRYDVERLPKRPTRVELMEFRIPNEDAKIRVRKRA
ncbi:MAG: hypothetical protein Q9160_003723 [Pyrenula sp. 1 TL-2023]